MNRDKKNGFTLLEMLLVLTIASTVMVMITAYITQKSSQAQRDKVVVQMQQILDASLAYYNLNGAWPITGFSTGYTRVTLDPAGAGATNGKALFAGNFIPSSRSFYINPLGLGTGCNPLYSIDYNTATGVFGVVASMCGPSSVANATIIAGQLPSGFITSSLPAATGGSTPPSYSACTAGSMCYVVAQVNMPGQNLNNARSVNFAGVYHNGACVPAPTCPAGFSPSIVVSVAQVSGNADSTPGNQQNLYPIESFAAYAYGSANGTATPSTAPGAPSGIADCFNPASPAGGVPCLSRLTPSSQTITASGTNAASQLYWRVCLLIQTTNGQVNRNAYSIWAQNSMLVAITRCTPANENGGSDFTVYSQ